MGDNSVSIFHFTDTISQAKLKKYYKSTSRGMAPAGTSQSSHAKNARQSHDPGNSTASTEPPSKKPRLTLKGPRRASDEGEEDTIAVSRPKNRPTNRNIRFKYSEDMVMPPRSPVAPAAQVESPQMAVSPAPSSGLSSLVSAPPSEKETSPFVDPGPPGRKDYGDLLSWYIDGGDDDPEPIAKPKAVAKSAAKTASKSRKSISKQKVSKAPAPATHQPPPSKPAPQPQTQSLHLLQGQGQGDVPQQEQGPPARQHHAPPVHQPQPQLQQPSANAPRPQQAAPAHVPPNFPHNRPPGQGLPRPAAIPQPIVQFSEIVHDPPPTKPDTVAINIKKLRALSLALTTFGGAPLAPPLSPSPPPAPAKAPPDSGDNPLDNFLSFFDADGDDEGSELDRVLNELDHVLKNPGTLDGPLTHGIVFIQNALKSWAQQRVSQMYTQQYHQQLQSHQHFNAKRGPGRPRKFDEPTHLLPPSPVIQMDLAATPEGNAIKAFQAVLDSECLRVNVRLPPSLASALRQLYMQIDLLINQGEREPPAPWQCMSYSAQISAHKARVDRWKEHQAKALEETQRQQTLAHQNMMAQMGLPPQQHYPMTPEQAEHAHAVELETRRAQVHAHQQPYIRQQHLNPLQLGIHPSGPPMGLVPSQSANGGMRPASVGPHNGRSESMGQTMSYNGAPMHQISSSSPGVQLDKMKIYMPGFLPRSGQNMKFSFTPQNEMAVQTFGASAFPGTDNPAAPGRGPTITHGPLQPPVDLSNNSTLGSRPSTGTVVPGPGPDTTVMDVASQVRRSIVQSLTPTENNQPASNGNFRAIQRPPSPVVATHGFTAVNAPAPRINSAPIPSPVDTSPNTIKVASKKRAGSVTTSDSPRAYRSTKRNASEINTTMPNKFPHPGAIVLDD